MELVADVELQSKWRASRRFVNITDAKPLNI